MKFDKSLLIAIPVYIFSGIVIVVSVCVIVASINVALNPRPKTSGIIIIQKTIDTRTDVEKSI